MEKNEIANSEDRTILWASTEDTPVRASQSELFGILSSSVHNHRATSPPGTDFMHQADCSTVE